MDPNFWNNNTFGITYSTLCQNVLLENELLTNMDSRFMLQDGLVFDLQPSPEYNTLNKRPMDEPMDVDQIEERFDCGNMWQQENVQNTPTSACPMDVDKQSSTPSLRPKLILNQLILSTPYSSYNFYLSQNP